jgi:hypothetical protein
MTPPNQPPGQKDIPTPATNKSVGTPSVLPDGKAAEAAINKIGQADSIPDVYLDDDLALKMPFLAKTIGPSVDTAAFWDFFLLRKRTLI